MTITTAPVREAPAPSPLQPPAQLCPADPHDEPLLNSTAGPYLMIPLSHEHIGDDTWAVARAWSDG